MDEIVIPFYLESQSEVGVRITSEAFPDFKAIGKTRIEAVEDALVQVRALLDDYRNREDKDIPETFMMFLHDESEFFPVRSLPKMLIQKTIENDYEVRCLQLPDFTLKEASISAAVDMAAELISNLLITKSSFGIRFDGRNPLRHDGRFLFYVPFESDITAVKGRLDFVCPTKWARFAYETAYIPLFGILFFIPLAFIALYDISKNPHWGYHYLGRGAVVCFLLSILPISLLVLLWYSGKL